MAHSADMKEFQWRCVHTGCIMADDVCSWWWAEAGRYTTHMVDFIEVQIKVICGGTLKSRTCRFDLQRQMSWQYRDNTTNLQPLLYRVRAGTLLSGHFNFYTHNALLWSHSATCWLCTSKKEHLLVITKKVSNPEPRIRSRTSRLSVSLKTEKAYWLPKILQDQSREPLL